MARPQPGPHRLRRLRAACAARAPHAHALKMSPGDPGSTGGHPVPPQLYTHIHTHTQNVVRSQLRGDRGHAPSATSRGYTGTRRLLREGNGVFPHGRCHKAPAALPCRRTLRVLLLSRWRLPGLRTKTFRWGTAGGERVARPAGDGRVCVCLGSSPHTHTHTHTSMSRNALHRR